MEKHDASFLALIKFAAMRIWLRSYESASWRWGRGAVIRC